MEKTVEELRKLRLPFVQDVVDTCNLYSALLKKKGISSLDATQILISGLGVALNSMLIDTIEPQAREEWLDSVVKNIKENLED